MPRVASKLAPTNSTASLRLGKTFSFFAAGVLGVLFASSAPGHEGKLVKFSGSVEVQLPGQPSQPATVGMMIPEGTVILTKSDGRALLETFSGGVAAIGKNSSVSVAKLNVVKKGDQVVTQEALLDLRAGNIVSTLDPAKKLINNYAVRTAKGVASARGTVYSVTVSNVTGDSVAALTGTVEVTSSLGTFFLPVGGGEPLFLFFGAPAGTPPTPLAQAVAADPSGALAAEVVAAVNVVAANVAASTSAVGGDAATAANTATAILTAVVKAAANAVPTEVAAITQAAVAAVTSTGSQTSNNANALAAITEAAVSAAPTQVAAIAQAAATAVFDTRVSEAVTAARASGITDPTALAAIAQMAATSAQATVQVMAQAALDAAIAATVVTSTDSADQKVAEAQAIAAAVSLAASTGSQIGATQAATAVGVATPTNNTTVSAPPTLVTAPAVIAPNPSTTVTPPATEQPFVITPVDATTKSPQ
jgi:hypothetical protein